MAVKWLAWLSELDTPPQPCELTFSSPTAVVLTLRLGHFVLVSVLLCLPGLRFTCFMIGIIFCPLTSIAVLIMESSFFHLDFNLRLLFRLSLSLPDLFSLTLIRGFLIILVTLFLDVIAFIRVVKLLGRRRGTGTAMICSAPVPVE